MIIQQAQVSAASAYDFQQSTKQVRAVIEEGRLIDPQEDSALPNSATLTINSSSISESISSTISSGTVSSGKVPSDSVPTEINSTQSYDLQLLVLKAFIKSITGRNVTESTIDYTPDSAARKDLPSSISLESNANAPSRTVVNLNLLQESETSQVSIEAVLVDQDNNRLAIKLDVLMSRQYEETALSVLREEGLVTDPLVINTSGTVNLSANRVAFDLDSDDELEMIASLGGNSAYLALDKNADGVINNGRELFGPQTGNGFEELAAYDQDNNGFIDAGDDVFSSLMAFSPSRQSLEKLSDLGITAIYLGAIESPFRLTDSNNNTLGQIRSTSFTVNEQGLANSIQQLDLTT